MIQMANLITRKMLALKTRGIITKQGISYPNSRFCFHDMFPSTVGWRPVPGSCVYVPTCNLANEFRSI